MALRCEVYADVDVDPSLLCVLRYVIERSAVLDESVPRGEWGMTVRITDDETISEVHRHYFGVADPTDVISFPSGDDLEGTMGYLGDVLISIDTARGQANDAGHSTERELAFLALHGMLHLCGHDDRSDAERMEMYRRQSELLDRCDDV